MAKKSKKLFFLFNIVNKKDNLKKNEVNMITQIFFTLCLILLIIDIVAILFFIKTNKRINELKDHEYTQIIKKNIEDSKIDHAEYAKKSKELIKNQNLKMNDNLDHLQINVNKIESSKLEDFNIDSLDNFLISAKNLENKKITRENLEILIESYNSVEKEMMEFNNKSIPLKKFHDYNETIQESLKNLLEKIKNNLNSYLEELLALAEGQNVNQNALYRDMKKTLDYFKEVYSSIKKKGKFVKLNNFYSTKFLPFERNYVPFQTEFYEKYFGAKLSFDDEFTLRLPRVYFCNLTAFIYSDNEFGITIQYQDKEFEENEYGTGEVFSTNLIRGKLREKASYNEYHIFKLEPGKHSLYLRMISERASSQIHMSNLTMNCVSYRNFIKQ